MGEFIAKKREMFLVQMSLDTKREEIRKLEEKAAMKVSRGSRWHILKGDFSTLWSSLSYFITLSPSSPPLTFASFFR